MTDYCEPRELRNKRIALEALGLLRRAAAGELGVGELTIEVDSMVRRWEDRGAGWVRPGPAMLHPDDWVSANDLAAEADMSAAAIRRLHYRGKITAIEGDDGRPRYNVGEVLRYRVGREFRPGAAL